MRRQVAEHRMLLYPDRRRAPIVFWTSLGMLAIAGSILSFAFPVLHLARRVVQLGPSPTLGVLGVLLVLHVQLVYAALLKLQIDEDGIAFRNLLGTRRLAWADIATIDPVSALTPAGRGGNMSGLRLRTRAGTVTIPDVFTVRRDALRALLLQRIVRL